MEVLGDLIRDEITNKAEMENLKYTAWKKEFLNKCKQSLSTISVSELVEKLENEDVPVEYKNKIVKAHSKKQVDFLQSIKSVCNDASSNKNVEIIPAELVKEMQTTLQLLQLLIIAKLKTNNDMS